MKFQLNSFFEKVSETLSHICELCVKTFFNVSLLHVKIHEIPLNIF